MADTKAEKKEKAEKQAEGNATIIAFTRKSATSTEVILLVEEPYESFELNKKVTVK